ncbi:putative membrane protein [Streptomyces glaucescens]|uniref:Putative membrane protein n=1 Tax=Streptomyces glaucescens TaxID=1907 RepID=A0A089XCS9_STRGA|nr:putative membrane protein [Streptomyces glaucescens]
MPRGRHRHSPPLHRLLPPSAIAGLSLVCAVGPWVFTEPMVLRGLAAAAAVTAVVGAVVMRRWDTQAGKRVAELTRARASDEWRFEERVAELESDLDESRELRRKLEQRLRAKRAELAGLRNEHAALLRRYATAETERASALEGRRLLEIETTSPARALPPAPVREQQPEQAGQAADAVPGGPAVPALSSPEGSRLFLRAGAALARLSAGTAPEASADAAAPGSGAAPGAGDAEDASPEARPRTGADDAFAGPAGADGASEAGAGAGADAAVEMRVGADDASGTRVGADEPSGTGGAAADDASGTGSGAVGASGTGARSGSAGSGATSTAGVSPDGAPEPDVSVGTASGPGVSAGASSGPGVSAGAGATDVPEATVPRQGTRPGSGRPAEAEAAREDEARGKPEAADGQEHAAAAPTDRSDVPADRSAGPRQPAGHFAVPTAVAVVPPAPARRPAVEGGFDFFGTKAKSADSAALEAVQNEDLADVVGQEALDLHKAETEGRAGRPAAAEFKPPSPAVERAVGQVIDLTAHDETEQIDIQGLRTAAS